MGTTTGKPIIPPFVRGGAGDHGQPAVIPPFVKGGPGTNAPQNPQPYLKKGK